MVETRTLAECCTRLKPQYIIHNYAVKLRIATNLRKLLDFVLAVNQIQECDLGSAQQTCVRCSRLLGPPAIGKLHRPDLVFGIRHRLLRIFGFLGERASISSSFEVCMRALALCL